MALFTDPDVIALDDLLQFESSLVQVSSTHGIDVQTKIKIASDGIGDKLLLWLLRAGQSDPQANQRASIGLKTVVVTPAIYRWLCFDALARVFAEAYNVQLNTRFQGKWTEYQKEAQEASNLVYASGIGVVLNPLSKPALPTVVVGSGAIQAPALFVQTAWTDAQGGESALSPVNGMVLNGFASVHVSVTDDITTAPKSAIGWNVYAGERQDKLTRQNSDPLPLGTNWQMPDSGVIAGSGAEGGQTADVLVMLSGRLQRG